MITNIFLFLNNLFVSPVYAVQSTTDSTAEPPRIDQLAQPISNIFDMILPVGALIAVAMMIYGGYMWIVSGGDPSKKQLAQGTLTWSLFGLVFLFLIKAILKLILDTVGA